MNLGEELINALSPTVLFSIFGIPITDTVVVMWIIMAFIILFAFIITRNLRSIPGGKQNIAEVLVDFVNSLARSNIGHHGDRFAPYLGSVLLFLVFSNIVSIFNIIPEWIPLALRPPTRDINVTASLAIMSIVLVLISGIWIKKPLGWLKSFIEPIPIILPFKILDYFIRPLSLCFRLFGNILGAFIIMELVYSAMAFVFPAFLSIYFDMFDGILQAYIFVFLTSLYISEAIE